MDDLQHFHHVNLPVSSRFQANALFYYELSAGAVLEINKSIFVNDLSP